jgi:ABC-type lipoprotein release transport system permease subunit
MQPVVAGLVAGAAVSLAAGRAVESLLFGVTPRDGVTFAVVLVGIAGCGLIACLVPALRAARIAPAATLRAN